MKAWDYYFLSTTGAIIYFFLFFAVIAALIYELHGWLKERKDKHTKH